MLQSIHDNAKGWIAYLIVGLISVPFALFGINEYFSGGGAGAVATVDGEEITKQEVQQEVSAQRQRMASLFGKIPVGLDENMLRRSSLEALINKRIIEKHAKDQGYRASNEEVLDVIRNVPQFQRDGKFSIEQYQLVMDSVGRSRKAYEEGIRRTISNNQFLDGINDTALLSSLDSEQLQQLANQTRDIEVYEEKVADILDTIKVSDEAVAEYYKENKQKFKTEEKVSLAYVELSKELLAKTIEVNDDDLLGYYQDEADRFVTKGQFKASHIRVSITEEQDKEKAKAKAEAIYQSIKSGEKTFEQAMEVGDDETLYAESGEDIGFIKQGVMPADFEKAVFAGKEGEVSRPVETANGVEIIKVLSLVPAKSQSFEEAKEKIRETYLAEQADKQFDGLYEELKVASYENDSSLDPAAEAVGVPIKTSELFSRNSVSGIFKNRELIDAAFSDKVLNKGTNSALIELTPEHIIVVRLADHKLPEQKSLELVKEQVVKQVKYKQARAQVKEKMDALYETITKSGEFSVGDDASKIVKHDGIKRNNTELPRQLVIAAFKLKAPEEGKKVFKKIMSINGDIAIIALNAVKKGASEVDEKVQDQWMNDIANRERNATMQALLEHTEVERFVERLNAE